MKNYTKKYNHFTIQDRKNLKVLYNKGKNYTEIGYELGKNRRSIQRELARNSKISFHSKQKYYYSSGIAQQKAQHRKFKPKIKEYKFNQIRTFFEHHLDNKMNIEQIYLQFKLKHPNEKVPCIQTIYNWYHKKLLPCNFKMNTRKVLITKSKKICSTLWHINKRHISKRPQEELFGHFEIDTVYSSQSKTVILTLNERSTMKYWTMKMPNRKASTTYLHLQILINKIGLDKFKSITSDNGNEFALSNMIEQKTGILWYYCTPYCSGQRGQNERLNRDLRKLYPKKTNFKYISSEEIENASIWINNLVRKKLNLQTANMMYEKNSTLTKVKSKNDKIFLTGT